MKPLPSNRPVLWKTHRSACFLEVSRAELERRLGPPHVRNADGDGLGPKDRWSFRCDCGLELIVEHARQSSTALVWMAHLEVEHALAHLGISTDKVTWRADVEEPLPLAGWTVVRQDEDGNRFDICVLSVQAHAECFAAQKAAHAPEQFYFVEPRGMLPREERPSRSPKRWARRQWESEPVAAQL
ncbi:hypothetical protein [Archangium lipolyticum]|uniref:hypothetical protein n=1 Tax=Archangium lipolyticum TaxID=2970465 RepID=UPI002149DDB0|nr:hypothetical protein [Archangium lipolyticum]